MLVLVALLTAVGCTHLKTSDSSGSPTPSPSPTPTPPVVFPGPQSSGSLAITPNGKTLFVAGGFAPRLAYLRVGYGALQKQGEIPVGVEPTSVTVDPRGQTVYVTNRGAVPGTVSVLSVGCMCKTSDVVVGTEPTGCVLTPTGALLFVANSQSGTISVIRTDTRKVINTITMPDGFFPFALACTNDGDTDDSDERVYVTQFYGQLKHGTYPSQDLGDTDNGRVGKVTVVDVLDGATARVSGTITLADLATGFTADRTPFGGPTDAPTRAWPNLLTSITIRDTRAYVTSVGTSPEPPLHHDANQHAFLSVIDLTTGTQDVTQSYNLNVAAIGDVDPVGSGTPGRFLNVPWGLAFAPGKDVGYILSAGTDAAIRTSVDDTGNVTIGSFSRTGASSNGIVRVTVGKNPRAVVFDPGGSFAFVHNWVGRTVTAIELSTDLVTAEEPALDPPLTGSVDAASAHGEELFNTAVGRSSADGTTGRMSYLGFSSCFGCHPFGWTDTTVWSFVTGPRKTPSLAGLFARNDSSDQRAIGWSAVADEVADMELIVRNVSSNVGSTDPNPAQGLIVGVPTTDVPVFVPKANTGRSVDWNDLETYLKHGVRSPISPLRGSTDPDIPAGRLLFAAAGCSQCHGGAKWTSSRLTYLAPPTLAPTGSVSLTAGGELFDLLRPVDTFATIERTSTNTPALGTNGFAPPSLLGGWAFPPYFHNGQATAFEEVMMRVVVGPRAHRNVGVAGQLEGLTDRLKLMRFLRSIDDATVPF